MSTSESYVTYANRSESVAAADFDQAKAKGEIAEEATTACHAAAHAAVTAFFAPIADHHKITQASASPDYPSSSSEDWQLPLEPDATPDADYLDKNKYALNAN